jgi:polar amino acid transport system substrate-binding protein
MKKLLACVVALVAYIAFALLPAEAQQQDSRFDTVMKRGKLIVGISSEAPPFGFVNEKGELVGFDIDIAHLLAKALFGDDKAGRVELVKEGFAARWPNIESGAIDVGIQLTTIQPDRVLRVGFTRSYIDSDFVMVVRADSKIHSLADLNNADYSTAILTGPIQKRRADKYFPKAKQTVLDSTAAQFTAVKVNRVDAAQLDKPVALWYAKNNPDIRIIEERISSPVNNAIFMRLGDFKWWQVLDTLVGEMRGGSLFDDYSAIYEKWFGVKPQNLKVEPKL